MGTCDLDTFGHSSCFSSGPRSWYSAGASVAVTHSEHRGAVDSGRAVHTDHRRRRGQPNLPSVPPTGAERRCAAGGDAARRLRNRGAGRTLLPLGQRSRRRAFPGRLPRWTHARLERRQLLWRAAAHQRRRRRLHHRYGRRHRARNPDRSGARLCNGHVERGHDGASLGLSDRHIRGDRPRGGHAGDRLLGSTADISAADTWHRRRQSSVQRRAGQGVLLRRDGARGRPFGGGRQRDVAWHRWLRTTQLDYRRGRDDPDSRMCRRAHRGIDLGDGCGPSVARR